MQRSFTYTIDALPLFIEDGFGIGEVTGSAEINYSHDGDWGVESITLDGNRRSTPAERANGASHYTYATIGIDRGTNLYFRVVDGLETVQRGDVQDMVNNQIEEDRICAADDRADARRDAMMTGGW